MPIQNTPLSLGAKAGIVVGVLALIVGIITAICMPKKRPNKEGKVPSDQEKNIEPKNGQEPPSNQTSTHEQILQFLSHDTSEHSDSKYELEDDTFSQVSYRNRQGNPHPQKSELSYSKCPWKSWIDNWPPEISQFILIPDLQCMMDVSPNDTKFAIQNGQAPDLQESPSLTSENEAATDEADDYNQGIEAGNPYAPGSTRTIFNQLDRDGNAVVDRTELGEGMQALGTALSGAEIDAFMKVADEDGDGVITYEEFTHLAQSQRSLLGTREPLNQREEPASKMPRSETTVKVQLDSNRAPIPVMKKSGTAPVKTVSKKVHYRQRTILKSDDKSLLEVSHPGTDNQHSNESQCPWKKWLETWPAVVTERIGVPNLHCPMDGTTRFQSDDSIGLQLV